MEVKWEYDLVGCPNTYYTWLYLYSPWYPAQKVWLDGNFERRKKWSSSPYALTINTSVKFQPVFNTRNQYKIPSFKPTPYRQVTTCDDFSVDLTDYYQEKGPRKSRWPRTSTLILSITTLVFGLHSLYLTLQGGKICSNHSFQEGYETDWSKLTELVHKSDAYMCRNRKAINRDAKGDVHKCITIQRNVENLLSRLRSQSATVCWEAEPRNWQGTAWPSWR